MKLLDRHLQALTLLNDEAFTEFANAMPARILKEPSDEARLRAAYLMVLSRPARPDETERVLKFVKTRRDSEAGGASEEKVWASVSRALLNLDEFMTRE